MPKFKKKEKDKKLYLSPIEKEENNGNSWKEKKVKLPLKSNRHIVFSNSRTKRRKRKEKNDDLTNFVLFILFFYNF